VIHGMAESKEYDLIDHTKLTMEQATPEFWAAESKKHGKQPLLYRAAVSQLTHIVR